MSGIIGISPNMKSGAVGKYPKGHVIQTISETRNAATAYGSIAEGSYTVDVTDMEVTITAKFADSSFLITGYVIIGMGSANRVGMILHRDDSVITGAIGDARGSTKRVTSATINANNAYALDWQLCQCSFNYLDPCVNTTETVFSVRLAQGTGGAETMAVNRSSDDSDDTGTHMMSGTSTMTVQEIAG
jgi:hypothetical protein